MFSSPPTTSRTISWSGPLSPRPASIIPICGCGCWMTGRGNGCEQLAEELGAHYVCRVKGLHAKAGNVNNGLSHALSTGRRPQFVLLLDADFTVSRNILQRTLGLFDGRGRGDRPNAAAFLQSGSDPEQSARRDGMAGRTTVLFRLSARGQGRLGRRILLRNIRRGARVGAGIDRRHGDGDGDRGHADHVQAGGAWLPHHLPERTAQPRAGTRRFAGIHQTALALVPRQHSANLHPLVIFRYRRIGLINRLSCLDARQLLDVHVPIQTHADHRAVGVLVDGHSRGECRRAGHHLLAGAFRCRQSDLPAHVRWEPRDADHDRCQPIAVGIRHRQARLPWASSSHGATRSTLPPRVTRPTASLFIGGSPPRSCSWSSRPCSGCWSTCPPIRRSSLRSGYTLNIIWSVVSVAVLLLTIHICIEPPKRRRDERFVSGERAMLVTQDHETLDCVVRDISVGGALLECAAGWTGVMAGRLKFLVDGATVGFRMVTITGNRLTVQFDQDLLTRRLMTAKLFSGLYHSEIGHVAPLERYPHHRSGNGFLTPGRRVCRVTGSRPASARSPPPPAWTSPRSLPAAHARAPACR